jgi:hypothetical protein
MSPWNNSPTRRRGSVAGYLLIGLLLLTTIVIAVVAVLRIDLSGDQGNRLPRRAEYDIEKQKRIDPELIGYKRRESFSVAVEGASVVTFDDHGGPWVGGTGEVARLTPDGKVAARFSVNGPVRCLEVGKETVYVGFDDHVETFSTDGERLASWAPLGDRARVTALAVGPEFVFVADAGTKVVHRYDLKGAHLGRIGDKRIDPSVPGFVIPSPCFDLLLGEEGLLWVVNPGRHRVEAYTQEGAWEEPLTWGESAMLSKPRIAGFGGCCNPARLARLPDGGFVTAEKGILQVKDFDRDGKFRCVVTGPEAFTRSDAHVEETRPDHKPKVIDVGVDESGRVWVLDPNSETVRVFEKKGDGNEE